MGGIEFPPQPPEFEDAEESSESEPGGLLAFVRKKGKKRNYLERDGNNQNSRVRWKKNGDPPRRGQLRHEGKDKVMKLNKKKRTDLPIRPSPSSAGKDKQKWKRAIQPARIFRANKSKNNLATSNFKRAYYANSSRRARASIRKTAGNILGGLGVKGKGECWSVEVLEQVGAVFKSRIIRP